MKLRYFQTYDKNGVDSSIQLQFWNKEDLKWEDVPFVRCSDKEEMVALYNENYC